MVHSNVELDIFLLGLFRRCEALLVRILREKKYFPQFLFHREVQKITEIPEGAEPGITWILTGRCPGAPPGEAEVGQQHQHRRFGHRVTEIGDLAASESQQNQAAAPVPLLKRI